MLVGPAKLNVSCFSPYFFLETFASTYWNRLVTAIPISIRKTRFKHQIEKLACALLHVDSLLWMHALKFDLLHRLKIYQPLLQPDKICNTAER